MLFQDSRPRQSKEQVGQCVADWTFAPIEGLYVVHLEIGANDSQHRSELVLEPINVRVLNKRLSPCQPVFHEGEP